MRDGCVLKGDLFRPDTPEKLPVLLNRTPYDKKFPQISYNTLDPIRAAQRGYNVVFVDCRGRFASPGTFTCFTDEQPDGYDTIEHVARQPWADGKVGMFGASYMGATQWLAATQTPPSLKAMVPSITASDYHDNWTYQGGAFSLFFNVSWLMTNLALARLMREREEKRRGAQGTRRRDVPIDTMRESHGRPAAQGFSALSHRRALLLRLARPSLLRRLLAQALHRGVLPEDQCADAEFRRMVRYLRRRHRAQLPRDARRRRPATAARRAS